MPVSRGGSCQYSSLMYGWGGNFFRVQVWRSSSSAISLCDGRTSCELLDVCAWDCVTPPTQPKQTPIPAVAMTVLMSSCISAPLGCLRHTVNLPPRHAPPLPAEYPAGYESSHFTLCAQVGYVSSPQPVYFFKAVTFLPRFEGALLETRCRDCLRQSSMNCQADGGNGHLHNERPPHGAPH